MSSDCRYRYNAWIQIKTVLSRQAASEFYSVPEQADCNVYLQYLRSLEPAKFKSVLKKIPYYYAPVASHLRDSEQEFSIQFQPFESDLELVKDIIKILSSVSTNDLQSERFNQITSSLTTCPRILVQNIDFIRSSPYYQDLLLNLEFLELLCFVFEFYSPALIVEIADTLVNKLSTSWERFQERQCSISIMGLQKLLGYLFVMHSKSQHKRESDFIQKLGRVINTMTSKQYITPIRFNTLSSMGFYRLIMSYHISLTKIQVFKKLGVYPPKDWNPKKQPANPTSFRSYKTLCVQNLQQRMAAKTKLPQKRFSKTCELFPYQLLNSRSLSAWLNNTGNPKSRWEVKHKEPKDFQCFETMKDEPEKNINRGEFWTSKGLQTMAFGKLTSTEKLFFQTDSEIAEIIENSLSESLQRLFDTPIDGKQFCSFIKIDIKVLIQNDMNLGEDFREALRDHIKVRRPELKKLVQKLEMLQLTDDFSEEQKKQLAQMMETRYFLLWKLRDRRYFSYLTSKGLNNLKVNSELYEQAHKLLVENYHYANPLLQRNDEEPEDKEEADQSEETKELQQNEEQRNTANIPPTKSGERIDVSGLLSAKIIQKPKEQNKPKADIPQKTEEIRNPELPEINFNELIDIYGNSQKFKDSLPLLSESCIVYMVFHSLYDEVSPNYFHNFDTEIFRYTNLLWRVFIETLYPLGCLDMQLFMSAYTRKPSTRNITSSARRAILRILFQCDACIYIIDSNSSQYRLRYFEGSTANRSQKVDSLKFLPVTEEFALPAKNYQLANLLQIVDTSPEVNQDFQQLRNILLSLENFYKNVRNGFWFIDTERSLAEFYYKNLIQHSSLGLEAYSQLTRLFYNDLFSTILGKDKTIEIVSELYGKLLEQSHKAVSKVLQSVGNRHNLNIFDEFFAQRKLINGELTREFVQIANKHFDYSGIVQKYAPKIRQLIIKLLRVASVSKDEISLAGLTKFLHSQEQRSKLVKSLQMTHTEKVESLFEHTVQQQSKEHKEPLQEQSEQDTEYSAFLVQVAKHLSNVGVLEKLNKFNLYDPKLLPMCTLSVRSKLFLNSLEDGQNKTHTILRDQVWLSTLSSWIIQTPQEIRHNDIQISFHNQVGIDGGGPTNQWALKLLEQVLDPRKGLFSATKQHRLMPSSTGYQIIPDYAINMRVFGRILGRLCLYQNISASVPFCRYVFKLFKCQPNLQLEDLLDYDKDVYRSLKWIKENKIEEDAQLGLSFTDTVDYLGQSIICQLKPGGAEITVTEDNKLQYIQLLLRFKLIKSVQKPLKELVMGFLQIVPAVYVDSLSLNDLHSLFSTSTRINVEAYKAKANYSSCSKETQQVQWLFQIIQELTQKEQEEYLEFVTGKRRIVSEDDFKEFTVMMENKTDNIPSSTTCSKRIILGCYRSLEQMRSKLKMALKECEGFHNY